MKPLFPKSPGRTQKRISLATLNWRDPNMPVVRDYTMGDGSKKQVVDPDYERRYREMLMETSAHPSYKLDPTYNLAKNNAKRRR